MVRVGKARVGLSIRGAEKRDELRRKGLCVRCKKENKTHHSHCPECREKLKSTYHKYVKKKKGEEGK